MVVSQELIDMALAHASADAPREACGLLVLCDDGLTYTACKNISAYDDQFIIDPTDYANASSAGEIVAIVHSHYASSPEPSQADLAACEASGLPWLIVSYPLGTHKVIEPSGYVAPLLGRKFVHGVFDCYSIIRDYYRQELGIDLREYQRDEHWWRKGEDMYMNNFAREGFTSVPIETIQKHDLVLMQCRSDVVNHAAIYVGDMQILQHLEGRLSSRDVYGGYWQKSTALVIRHEALHEKD